VHFGVDAMTRLKRTILCLVMMVACAACGGPGAPDAGALDAGCPNQGQMTCVAITDAGLCFIYDVECCGGTLECPSGGTLTAYHDIPSDAGACASLNYSAGCP